MQQPKPTRRFPTPAATPAAGSFLALLLAEAHRSGQEFVLDVAQSIEWLYGLPCPHDPDILEFCDSTIFERVAREYRRAEAELLERICGAACWLDTLDGPLFLGEALYRLSGGQDVSRGESGTWPQNQPLEAA